MDAVRGAAERCWVELEHEVPEEPPLVVMGDPDWLDKVFINLLVNALKFTPPQGRVRVRIGTLASPRRVWVELRDNGIGIPQDLLPHVFERFWQADTSSTRARQGAEVGLSICHTIVGQHEGKISAWSELSEFTEFTIRLPGPP